MSREVKMALCTVSGGFDSAAALLWSLERYPTQGIFVNYGQRYLEQERRAVRKLMDYDMINAHPNWRGLSSATVDMTLLPRGTPWIPYRNLVIAALLTNIAASRDAQVVVFGSKSAAYRPDDPVSFLDSTQQFYRALEALIVTYTEPQNISRAPAFELPLVGWSKKQVMEYLHERGIKLARLWNCYREDGRIDPCGKCEHCMVTQPLIAEVTGQLWNPTADATGTGRDEEPYVETVPDPAEGGEA